MHSPLSQYGRCAAVALSAALFAGSVCAAPALAETPIKPITQIEIDRNLDPPSPVDLATWQGQTTVIYAWGDWCRICTKSTPEVIALAKANPSVRFLFINTDEPARPVSVELPANIVDARVRRSFFGDEVMRKKGFRFSQLGLVFAMPAYFVLDAQGVIRHIGNGSRFPAQIAQILRELPSAPAPR